MIGFESLEKESLKSIKIMSKQEIHYYVSAYFEINWPLIKSTINYLKFSFVTSFKCGQGQRSTMTLNQFLDIRSQNGQTDDHIG